VTRVLVIDDEAPILRALRINLTARQYEVAVATDACRGIDLDGSLGRAMRAMAEAGVVLLP